MDSCRGADGDEASAGDMTAAAFGYGKLVVVDAPRSAGSPWDDFKGETGLVKSRKNTPSGFVYTLVFDQASAGVPDAVQSAGRSLQDVPEKWLRKGGILARSSNVKPLTLDAVLKACRVHRIPVFQRRYCWRASQWRLLWKDLVAVKNDPALNNHSLGRLMLFEQPDGSCVVLDGQQRLTTLMLLLVALRHRLEALGEIFEELREFCSTDRFIPTMDDRLDFRRCMQEYRPAGESSILKAKCVFAELCDQLNEDSCFEMADAALNRLSFLCFRLEGADSVQSVFEGMAKKNLMMEQLKGTALDLGSCAACYASGDGEKVVVATHWGPDGHRLCTACAEQAPGSELMTPGMPMVPVDLIRNFVIDHFGSEASMIRVHNEYWRPLEAAYGHSNESLEAALASFLEAQGLSGPSRWALYSGFVTWWRSFVGTATADVTDVEDQAACKMAALLEGLGVDKA